MARRTDTEAVEGILLDDYGPREDGTSPDLEPFIATASALTDRVATCASNRGWTLSSTELELIERWLSAHMYVMADQNFSARSNQGRSGTFQGQTAMRLEASKYGQTALTLDISGCLESITKRQSARVLWLGTAPDDQ